MATYSGSWASSASSGASGGHDRSATPSRRERDVAVHRPGLRDRGDPRVHRAARPRSYVDGVYVGTVEPARLAHAVAGHRADPGLDDERAAHRQARRRRDERPPARSTWTRSC